MPGSAARLEHPRVTALDEPYDADASYASTTRMQRGAAASYGGVGAARRNNARRVALCCAWRVPEREAYTRTATDAHELVSATLTPA